MTRSADDDYSAQVQQSLLESSLETVTDTFQQARDSGMRCPVIFVLDCDDTLGGEIARAWCGDEAVDDALANTPVDADGGESTTVLTRAVEYDDCREEVPVFFPYLADSFHAPPAAREILAVVVAEEGAATFTCERDSPEDD